MTSREVAENWVKSEWNSEARFWVLQTTPMRPQKGYKPGSGKAHLVRRETRPSILKQFSDFGDKLVTSLESGYMTASEATSRINASGYSYCLWVVDSKETLVNAMTIIFQEGNDCWADSLHTGGIKIYTFWHER